ncbi:hypothetical protein B0H14DRAFT_2637494 [Mycena olivaceomarginata]|nr:hypothetical protein B0H14DRAFT_2637494 [Mycena olivaceomarginata]
MSLVKTKVARADSRRDSKRCRRAVQRSGQRCGVGWGVVVAGAEVGEPAWWWSAPDPSSCHSPGLGATDKETKTDHVSYARAVSATRSDSHESQEHSESRGIVIRFDLEPPDIAKSAGAHPQLIYNVLHRALSPSPGKRLFAGVRYTRNWNLVIQVETGTGTTQFMIEKYATSIWNAIRPVLGYPAGHPCPTFETGNPWHSVVFHNVPSLEGRKSYDLLNVRQMLAAGGLHHTVKAFSILCTDKELSHRWVDRLTVPMRMTVDSRPYTGRLESCLRDPRAPVPPP